MFKDYFCIFEVKNIAANVIANEGITKYVRKYLRRRFKKVRYFEQFELNGIAYMLVGTSRLEKKTRVKVFAMELYASLKDDRLRCTFPVEEKVIGTSKVKIYTIPRFGWRKLK